MMMVQPALTAEVRNEVTLLSLWVLPNAKPQGVVRDRQPDRGDHLAHLTIALVEDGSRTGRRRSAIGLSLGSGPPPRASA